MDANLKEGSSNLMNSTSCILTRPLLVKQWMETGEAMIMQLDDGTVQVITKHLLPYNFCYYNLFYIFYLDQLCRSHETHQFCFN